jgi:general secretion pathway protein G
VTIGALAIALVIALVVRNRDAVKEKKRAIARVELSEIEKGLNRFYLEKGYFPTTDQGLGALMPSRSFPPGEIDPGILRPPPSDSRPLLDPWGHPFEYQSDGNSYVLESLGPSGTERDSDLTIRSITP